MKQVVFMPGQQAERYRCYDRIELLKPWGENPVLRPEKPWEGECVAYPCVLFSPDESLYKMWYMTVTSEETSANDGTLIDNHAMKCERSYVCYAVSRDGINWTRPVLNILRTNRYPENNIVYQDAGFFCGCPTVILDEHEPDPSRRYKMMIYDNDGAGSNGIRTLGSADGINWVQVGAFPAIPSQDTPSLWWDRHTETYYAFLKDRVNGQRCRLVSHSKDFENWTEPVPCLVPDGVDSTVLNYYAQCAFSDFGADYAFLSVFDLATQTTGLELAAVREGLCVRLPSRPIVLNKGNQENQWNYGGVYAGNGEPVLRDGLRWLYYDGSKVKHDTFSAQMSIGLAGFRPGRLVGQQFEGEGYFVTLPILCPGGRLALNAETGSNSLRVEVCDSGYGGVITPYLSDACFPVTGDDTLLPVAWQETDNLDALANRYIRLKIIGKNARVYGATFI